METTGERHLEGADAVVVGRLVRLGPPPPAWSGRFAAFQEATYEVTRVFSSKVGLQAGAEIVVRHPVVAGAPTADPTRPALAPDRFAEGASLVLYLRGTAGAELRFDCMSEIDGALPATGTLVATLERRTRQEP